MATRGNKLRDIDYTLKDLSTDTGITEKDVKKKRLNQSVKKMEYIAIKYEIMRLEITFCYMNGMSY